LLSFYNGLKHPPNKEKHKNKVGKKERGGIEECQSKKKKRNRDFKIYLLRWKPKKKKKKKKKKK